MQIFAKVFKFKDFFKIKRGHQGGGWALGYVHANSNKNKETRPIRPTMRPHDDEMIV